MGTLTSGMQYPLRSPEALTGRWCSACLDSVYRDFYFLRFVSLKYVMSTVNGFGVGRSMPILVFF